MRDQYRAGLEKLRSRKVDIAVAMHPNHLGTLDKVGEDRNDFRPFHDPDAWEAFLNERLRMLDEAMAAS